MNLVKILSIVIFVIGLTILIIGLILCYTINPIEGNNLPNLFVLIGSILSIIGIIVLIVSLQYDLPYIDLIKR